MTEILNDECVIYQLGMQEYFYAVVVKPFIYPPAVFLCAHCAKAWAEKTFISGYSVVSFKHNPQFLSDFLDKLADSEIVHSSDNSAAVMALNKHDRKV